MKKIIGKIVVIALLGLSSCGDVEMDDKELFDMLFSHKRGVLGGIEIGDNWEDVKKNHHPNWTVREQLEGQGNDPAPRDILQLRKDWDEGYNFMYIKFEKNDEGLITALELSIHANTEANIQTVRELVKDFRADYNVIFSTLEIDDNWQYTYPNGESIEVLLQLMELDSGSVVLSVKIQKVT